MSAPTRGKAQPGDLFFAIKGEHHDGHDYLNEVAAKNVAAVVVEKSKAQSPKSNVVSGMAMLVVE